MKDEAPPILLYMLGGLGLFALMLAGTIAVVVLLVRAQRRGRRCNATP